MNTCKDIHYQKLAPKCPTPFRNTNQVIGKGSSGTVFQACCGDDCSYAMKVIHDPDGNDHIHREVELQNIVSKEGYTIPVYETQICGDKNDTRESYVMDRLDRTLYQDIFELSPEQNRIMQQIYREVCIPYAKRLQPHHKNYAYIHQEWTKFSSFKTISQFQSFYKSLHRTIAVIDAQRDEEEEAWWKDVEEPQLLDDTKENKKRKLTCILKTLNLFDGLNQFGVHHNDTHMGNFMRKQGDEYYKMIDFGMASETHGYFDPNKPDVKYFQQRLYQSINHSMFFTDDNDRIHEYPAYVNYRYIIDSFPKLEEYATFEYNTFDWIREDNGKMIDKLVTTFSGRRSRKSRKLKRMFKLHSQKRHNLRK